jgi:hypothetical protein
MYRAVTLGLALAAIAGSAARPDAGRTAPEVTLLTVPDGGIQPQAFVDAADVLHLLYFTGPAAGGDLYYVRREPNAPAYSRPVRVNSMAGTALATGSMRGGQLALGAKGRVHAAWYGAKSLGDGDAKRTPVWYARLGDGGTAFEPQVNVAVASKGIDGTTVAADGAGNVYVAWHGLGEKDGEAYRTVYVARSRDDGAHFAREEPAPQASTGACGCCGLRALVDSSGKVNILYRAATEGVHRDAAWLTLSGTATTPVVLQRWELNACPMSTFAMARDGNGLMAGWEREQQIYYARLDPARGTFSAPSAVQGQASRKHPSIAVNSAGVSLIAWTEGTGWARGGTMAWEMIDRGGERLRTQSKAAVVPVWGLVAAAAHRDGSFVVVH